MKSIGYYLDFVTMPIVAWTMMLIAPPTSLVWLASASAGFLGWTMAEYWIHRVLFHEHFRREHWRHHLDPTDEEGAVPTAVSHAAFLVLLVLTLTALGREAGSALTFGAVVGYLVYISLHHAIHHGWLSRFGLLGGVVRRHDLHHRGVEANFNFLLPLGDWIFGTYREAPYGVDHEA